MDSKCLRSINNVVDSAITDLKAFATRILRFFLIITYWIILTNISINFRKDGN